MTNFSLQPINVATETEDEEGVLVLADNRLVAVLVRLRAPYHHGIEGHWFLEAGFGRCATAMADSFVSLEAALRWIVGRFGTREPAAGSDLAALAAAFAQDQPPIRIYT